MAKEVMVELGGNEYVLRSLPVRRAKQWREDWGGQVKSMLAVVREMGTKAVVETDDAGRPVLSNNLVSGLVGSLWQVGELLVDSMDMLVDAFFAYADFDEATKQAIEESATDDEIMVGVWEVVKLAYPFGVVYDVMNLGANIAGTSKSLPSQNGAG